MFTTEEKEQQYNIFQDTIYGSKEFSFEYGDNGNTVLELTNYRSGDSVYIDLSLISKEVFNSIVVDMEDIEDDY